MSRWRERVGFGLLALSALAVVLIAIGLFGLIASRGLGSLSWEFLTAPPRHGMREGGIFPAILGTVYLTFITAVFAIPIGVGAAVYLTEYARDGWHTRLVRLAIRNLSGVPSIVYGLFGVALFVHGLGAGLSILASGLTLGLLTLPWTITASEEALKTVPRDQRDGALALGATKWETVRTVVLPGAAPGIMTGCVLGLARAAGETAPLLFTGVTFSTPHLPASVADQFMALPYHLYILATQHQDIATVRPLAYGTALVLLVLVSTATGAAALVRARLRRKAGR